MFLVSRAQLLSASGGLESKGVTTIEKKPGFMSSVFGFGRKKKRKESVEIQQDELPRPKANDAMRMRRAAGALRMAGPGKKR